MFFVHDLEDFVEHQKGDKGRKKGRKKKGRGDFTGIRLQIIHLTNSPWEFLKALGSLRPLNSEKEKKKG